MSDTHPFIHFWRRGLPWMAAGALYLAATLIWLRPLPGDATTKTVFFRGDTALNAYILAWGQHSLLHRPWDAFEANFFYPLQYPLGLSENLLGAAALALPLAPFQNPILVYNVLLLGSFFLSALLWFAVLRRWGISWWAAWIGGFAFGFLPWRYGQLGHAQLLYTWWHPPALALAESWVRKARWSTAILLGVMMAASFYTGVYNAYFLALFLAAFMAAGLYLCRHKIRWRRLAAHGIAAGAVCGVMIAPAMPAYLSAKRLLGNPNPLDLVELRGASFGDYLRPTTLNWFWGHRLPLGENPYSDVPWEHILFCGFLLYGMAGAGLGAAWLCRRRLSTANKPGAVRLSHIAAMLGAGGAFLFLISLGPRFYWFGEPRAPNPLYLVFYHSLPGFDAIRVPTRAALFVGLAMSGLAAMALDRLWACPAGWKRRVGRGTAAALGVVLIVEFFNVPVWIMDNPDYRRHRKAHETIAELPRGVVLTLPIEYDLNFLTPLTATPHFYPLVNGHSGHMPEPSGFAFSLLREEEWSFAQADLIQSLNVRYLVLDRWLKSYAGPWWLNAENHLRDYLQVHGFEVKEIETPAVEATLYELTPPAQQRGPKNEGRPLFGYNHTVTPKENDLEIFLWMENLAPLAMIAPDERWLRFSVRGYDADDDRFWKKTFDVYMPEFLPRGYPLGVPIKIPPKGRDETHRIKVRIRQDDWDMKNEYEFRIE